MGNYQAQNTKIQRSFKLENSNSNEVTLPAVRLLEDWCCFGAWMLVL
jgi:hypothetical protein